MAQNAYDYVNSDSYAGVTYGKTASVLLTLEGIIGQDTMAKAMHTYFMKYRFTHPDKGRFPEDHRRSLRQGSSLVLQSGHLRLTSSGLRSSQASIPSPQTGSKKRKRTRRNRTKTSTVYQSYVTVHRKDDFVMPLEVEVKFVNGEKVREHWDGQARWTRFGYQKKTKVESAEIDPDHKIYIDRNNFNNSFVLEPNSKPAQKVSNYWLFMTQWFGQAMAWWAV